MADREVGIRFRTTSEGDGAAKTKADIKDIQTASKGASVSIDELEKELKQAEAALKKAGTGTAAFKKLQNEIRKTKDDLKELKVGKLDSKGLDSLGRRLSTLRQRTVAARSELEKPPRTSWADRLASKFTSLGNSIPGGGKAASFFSTIATKGSAATVVVGGLVATLGSFIGIVKQGIGTVSVIEDLESSFTTLLGSIDAAQTRIEEVRELALTAPVSVGGLATANRVLTTLTGNAFASAEALRLVGDAATVANRPGEALDHTIANLSLHIGRLYSSLRSGKGEIGESTLRLQEMGIITPQLSFKLRELHQEANKGEEAWGLLEKSLGKFSGEMERRSQNISGKLNNLGDSWNKFTSTVAKPFIAPFKASIGLASNALESLGNAISKINQLFGVTERQTATFLGGVNDAVPGANDAMDSFGDAAKRNAEIAQTEMDALASKFDAATAKAKRLADQQQELAKLRLRDRIASIDSNDSLNDAEKIEKKAQARLAAGEEVAASQVRALEIQLKNRVAQERVLAAKTKAAQDEAAELRQEIADLGNQEERAVNFGTRLDFKLEEVKTLQREKEELEKALADIDPDRTSNLLEAAQRAGIAGLKQTVGTLVPFIDTPIEMAERVKDLNIEIEQAFNGLERLFVVQEKLGAPQNLRIDRAAIEKDLIEVEARVAALGERDTVEAKQAVDLLREEIALTKERFALERKVERKESRSTVLDAAKKEIEKESGDAAKALETAKKTLESSREEQRKEIAQTLESLGDLTKDEKSKESFKGIAEAVEGGDLSNVTTIIKQALAKRNGQVFDLGEVLKDQVAQLGKFEQSIATTQQQVDLLESRKKQQIQRAKSNVQEAIPEPEEKEEPQRRRRIQQAIREVDQRVVGDLPGLDPVTRDVTQAIVGDLPNPDSVTQEVSQRITGTLPKPDSVTRDVSQRLAGDLPALDSATQEITREVTKEPEPPKPVKQEVIQETGREIYEREKREIEQRLVGDLPDPEPVTQEVFREIVDEPNRIFETKNLLKLDSDRGLETNLPKLDSDRSFEQELDLFPRPAPSVKRFRDRNLLNPARDLFPTFTPGDDPDDSGDAVDATNGLTKGVEGTAKVIVSGLQGVIAAQANGRTQIEAAVSGVAAEVANGNAAVASRLSDLGLQIKTLRGQINNLR